MKNIKTKHEVVVVDDDPTQLAILVGLLTKVGLQARAFERVETALDAMTLGEPPDLIVTDLYMPGIDGWCFSRLLRSPEYVAFNEIPILIVSATFAGDYPERIAADVGADAFLPSPVDGKAFVAQVLALLSAQREIRLPRVLLVEDDKSLVGLLKIIFTAHGYQVDAVTSIHEAKTALATTTYDVAVLDYYLSDERGDSLIDFIHDEHPDCACIMMTGDSSPVLAQDWMKRGATAYLCKPFAPEVLIELCARARRERTLRRVENLLEVRTRELRMNEARYRNVFAAIPDGIWIHEADGTILDVNETQCHRIGLSRDALIGRSVREFITVDHASRMGENVRRVLQGELCIFETIHLLTSGAAIEVEVHERSIPWGDGTAILSISHDITDRKRAQEAEHRERDNRDLIGRMATAAIQATCLERFQEELLRLLGEALDVSRAYVFAYSHDKKTMDNTSEWTTAGATPQQNKLQGIAADETWWWIATLMRGDPIQYTTIADIPDARTFDELSAQGIQSILVIPIFIGTRYCGFLGVDECRFQRTWTSQERDVLSEATRILMGVWAEEELRQSEERFQGILRNVATVAVQGYAMDGKVRYWNRASETFYGYAAEEAIGRNLLDLIIPSAIHGAVSAAISRMVATGEAIPASEQTLNRKDGSLITVYSSHALVQVSGQKPELFCIDIDLTDHKRAEAQLRLQSLVLNQIQDRVTITDLNGGISYVNDAVVRDLGYDRNTLVGSTTEKYGESPDRGATQRQILEETLTHGVWRGEVVNRTAKGDEVLMDCRTQIILDEQGNKVAIAGISTDITVREKLERQLAQAQRVESIGRLAGGVAHDFNNMLQAILGNTELALERVGLDASLKADLEDIRRIALRSSELTRQLLAFARRQTVMPKVLDLNETVTSMLKMIRRLIGESITLVWNPGADLWPVRMDPAQMDAIMANLCVNARDAITGMGRIIVETRNTVLNESDCIHREGCLPGDYVKLTICDDGCGMDAETLSHLFEPFFTTKGLGKGTGLGLASVHGAVAQNGGNIEVASVPGGGTTFWIYLPRHEAQVIRIPEEVKPPVVGGGETILLVEDEQAILDITARMLTTLGYTVMPAATPGEAIRLTQAHSGLIDLLITDVVMPEMNGWELSENLRSLHPSMRRLFMSGYTSDVIAHQGVLDEGLQLIQKPFSKAELAMKLREVLG